MSGVASKIAQERAVAAGVGSIDNPVKFANQDFEKLKAEHSAPDNLFEDPQFPPSQGSVWKRPSEIQKNPVFIVEGADRDDICQGSINDCWLMSSIACLTMNKDSLSHVIPADQSFDKNYSGIFHFKFWQYGQWVDVVVDDRLPTKDNKLIFVKSKTVNEFWSTLLEKAYAKINGSYSALNYGYSQESLEDFTGGVCELYVTNPAPVGLFQRVRGALIESSLVTCTSVSKNSSKDDIFGESIIKNHIYSITGAEEVNCGENVVQIIRVRNPWGHKEWSGPWSDKSEEWNKVDPEVKAKLNIQEDDGEVWMPYTDFLTQYRLVEICNISLSEVCCGDHYNWCMAEFNGNWKKGVTSGGKNDKDTFWINPQYRITLEAPDGDTSKKCPIVVSLIQKDRRKKKQEGINYLRIGFYIYKINPEDKVPLGQKFFKDNKWAATVNTFFSFREVSDRFELLPGDYVIVAATGSESEEGDFYLRVFTKKPAGVEVPVVQATPFEPILTPDVEAEFDVVRNELQKGEFNEDEVKNLLKKMLAKYPDYKLNEFSTKTVRQMIKLMDVDNTGTLSTDEFQKLWLKVKNYLNIFQSVDTDNSGTINASEYRNGLIQAGFPLENNTVGLVVDRMINVDGITLLDQVVGNMMQLETALNMFKTLDPTQKGTINLSMSEWLRSALA